MSSRHAAGAMSSSGARLRPWEVSFGRNPTPLQVEISMSFVLLPPTGKLSYPEPLQAFSKERKGKGGKVHSLLPFKIHILVSGEISTKSAFSRPTWRVKDGGRWGRVDGCNALGRAVSAEDEPESIKNPHVLRTSR